jgi:hypothetical protein
VNEESRVAGSGWRVAEARRDVPNGRSYPLPATRHPGIVSSALLIARKDLAIEFRTRSAFFSAVVFALLAVAIFFFAWDPTAVASLDLAPGVLWVIFTFSGLLGLHRSLAWSGLSMIALHAIALLFDPTLHFGLAAVLVPFAAPWLALQVAAGVLAGWLALMLALSFRARKWIGQKGWRRLHYASFGAFALSLGHALVVGTDLHGLGGPVLALLSAGPVLWLGFYRLLVPRTSRRSQTTPNTSCQ